MSAREDLFRRVAGAFVDEEHANTRIDAYRAEVLDEGIAALRKWATDSNSDIAPGLNFAIGVLRARSTWKDRA